MVTNVDPTRLSEAELDELFNEVCREMYGAAVQAVWDGMDQSGAPDFSPAKAIEAVVGFDRVIEEQIKWSDEGSVVIVLKFLLLFDISLMLGSGTTPITMLQAFERMTADRKRKGGLHA